MNGDLKQVGQPPKAFVSYGWGDEEHDQWILDLANELVENGVDVELDKWKLRENEDKFVFMEKIVTDPEVKKVIMICDRSYKEKADARDGGVGTETQIISAEIYEQVRSDDEKKYKFCAVLKERDEKGKAYLPIYLKSRIYIDMSTPELRQGEFERLLRWIFDRPLHEKPLMGDRPWFLIEEPSLNLQTSTKFRSAASAVKQNRSNAIGFARDYFQSFAGSLEKLRITPLDGVFFDDQVFESINQFRPYRDEFVELIVTLCDYAATDNFIQEVHTFFEEALPFLFSRNRYDVDHFRDYSNDNYRFIIWDLFRLVIAVLIKKNKFELVDELLSREYYIDFDPYHSSDSKLHPFLRFQQPLPSFNQRTQRLQSTESIYVELVLSSLPSSLTSREVIQADFIMYLKDNLTTEFWGRGRWYPETLVQFDGQPFECFSRAESARFWEKFRMAIGASDKQTLGQFLEKYEQGKVDRFNFGYFKKVNPRILTNFEAIATKP